MQTTQSQTQFAASQWPAQGLVVAAIETLLRWQERAAQRHHIRGLQDRALKDVGLSRADIENEASKPFWQA